MRLILTVGLLWLISLASAQAAYIGNPIAFGIANQAGQPIGSPTITAQPPNPLIIQPQALFAPFPGFPGALSRQASFGDATGRSLPVITDGVLPISIAPPFKAAQPVNPALVVGLSPTPNYQCPYIASINITANATIITNPGGRNIYVCNAAVINGGTAQSVTLLEGTGTACATNPTYWLGGSGATTALAVSGGFALIGINWAMQKAGDNVCVIVSGSTNVSGTLTYGLY